MKKSLFFCFFVVLCALSACSDDPEVKTDDPTQNTDPVENQEIVEEIDYTSSLGLTSAEIQAVKSNNDFAWEFFGELSKDNTKNVVVSPLSVSIAMTMLANGAFEGSEVQKEILDVLGYSQFPISEVNSATMKLADGINRLDPEIDLTLANSLWVDTSLAINPAYVSILKNDFIAESFDIKPETFVSDVNNWCDRKTNGMIDKLLAEGANIPDMSLINATYFKGLWSKSERFDKNLTAEGDFHLTDGSTCKAEFMNAEHRYASRKNDKMEVVTIPFGKGSYNFQIIRPNDGVSIENCMQYLKSGKWNELMASLPDAEILDIKLPKFDIEYGKEIKELLAEIGMTKAIRKTDYFFAFPGGLKVTDILHKAHIRVDEEGAEAAAVTEMNFIALDPGDGYEVEPVEPRPFYLDHPFIYLITEKESGAIIFIGCVKTL